MADTEPWVANMGAISSKSKTFWSFIRCASHWSPLV
jgi:hypothetical protein